MGGKIFTTPGHDGPALNVPRLTSEQYVHMRDLCVAKLRTVYDYVAVPKEAPGKDSHGDVDIHVTEGEKLLSPTYKQDVGILLGAKRQQLGGVTASYALPLPGVDNAFCQIDVHHVRKGHEAWEMLMQSYGDLMQIVGKFLRYAGFTANDKALYVRIPEIEGAGWKKGSLVYLTHDTERFLKFIGLDYKKWEEGFATEEELFAWCCTGKYFSAKAFEANVENHNDRQRMKKRDLFMAARDWIMERESLCAKSTVEKNDLRKGALVDAITAFEVQGEYNAKIEAHNATQAEKAFWDRVTQLVPREGDNMGCARRALRRWVVFDEKHSPVLSLSPEMDIAKQPQWTAEMSAAGDEGAAIYAWIEEHWEEAYRKEKEREAEGRAAREAEQTAAVEAEKNNV